MAATAGSPSAQPSSSARVLIVDDDVALCQMWEGVLGANGYETRSVHHGDKVLEAVQEYRPDVVVLDVKLPGTDGITLCQRLKEQPETAHVRVLLCSGYVGVDLERARSLADSIVRKPVPPGLLLASLEVLTSALVGPARRR